MKYDVEMGSSAMTYIPSFIKTGFAIQKLIGGHTQTRRHTDSVVTANAYFHFFKISKVC
jgi:hypothetical protein